MCFYRMMFWFWNSEYETESTSHVKENLFFWRNMLCMVSKYVLFSSYQSQIKALAITPKSQHMHSFLSIQKLQYQG